MEFLKKYWWAILLVALVAYLLYKYFYQKGPSIPLNTDPTNCLFEFDAANYESRIQEVINQINATPEWIAQNEERRHQSYDICGGMTMDECNRAVAIGVLHDQGIRKLANGNYCKIGA